MLRYFFIIFLSIGCISFALAGNLDSPAAPTDQASAIYTLEDIYNRLITGSTGSKRTGSFKEPTTGPTSTVHTINEIMSKAPSIDNSNGAAVNDVRSGKTFWGITSGQWGLKTGTANISMPNPAPTEKTGQTTSYTAGDDGAVQKGAAWSTPRFTDNGNGTVTDNNTGLIWLKDANCFTRRTWAQGLSDCAALANGSCSLTDGSQAGDWRLPNIKELKSLIDYSKSLPALPSSHLFSNIQSTSYWSSTTLSSNTDNAFYINLDYGSFEALSKTNSYYVLPVRGGQ
ncbi:MAG: DUF1566 domain-containing protein [Desulfobacterales bacterium]|nr:DUF1566 domain-containing protein [Desulfobacterales bacterium]MBF0396995.1 DUF1566 domain-containing protein [Desulfobacterales bacterium]